MKNIIFFFLLSTFLVANQADAQKYFTRSGSISFYSEAPLENIEAHNKKATSVLDIETGNVEFAVLIKAFQFEKALMQEHFNENYMESNKYPKALFKGTITNIEAVNFEKDGQYTASVKGDLTIRDITHEIESEVTLLVKDETIQAQTSFEVAVADYEIEIPKVVRDNIAKIVRVDVQVDYELFKKKT